MVKTEMKAELERLCARWAALGPEDEGEKLTLQAEIFELVYRLFPGHEDGIGAVFLENWKSFDPAKGPAYGFFSSRIRLREKDAYRDQKAYQDRMIEDAVQKNGGGESESLLAGLPAGPGEDPGERLGVDADVCVLISAMLELPRRLHGRANNPARHNYFRMFFAETVVACIRGTAAPESFRRRERDVFTAMKLEFLDYFMAEPCRTVDEIADSPLKPYGELVEDREMEETALPLPGDVYVGYLDRVERTKAGLSAVSQQKTAYRQAVREWLC